MSDDDLLIDEGMIHAEMPSTEIVIMARARYEAFTVERASLVMQVVALTTALDYIAGLWPGLPVRDYGDPLGKEDLVAVANYGAEMFHKKAREALGK
jgi:hypothetical protein